LPDQERQHFIALDSLRGIAALTVVLGHISSAWLPNLHSRYVANSYFMVDFFFVLSGFVICYSNSDKIRDLPSTGRFLWLRFWRLYPLHLTILVLFSVLGIAKLSTIYLFQPTLAGSYSLPFGGSMKAFFGTFASNVLLVHDLPWFQSWADGTAAGDANVPAWSISVEFYTYIAFAALVLLLVTRRRMIIASLAMITVSGFALFAIAQGGINSSANWFGLLCCLCGFFTGVIGYFVSLRFQKTGIMATIACAAFFGFCAIEIPSRGDLFVFPIALVTIVAVARSEGRYGIGLLRTRPMRWLGTISYSIYMTHYLIIRLVDVAARTLLHVPMIMVSGGPTLNPNPSVGAILTSATVGMVLGASHLSYNWIEKPMRDWSRSAGTKAKPRQL
jgi:peptidoglycan/LPS O-acetylase OafA/YrhL